jgi:hypothetical protein
MSKSQPATREELKEYCLRRLGAPILEINVDEDQVEDIIDDALQYFNERHFDGAERMYLKHKLTAEDIERFKTSDELSSTPDPNSAIWENRDNFIEIPDYVFGIQRVFGVSSNFLRNDLFGLGNQYYLMDLFSISSGGTFSHSNFDMVNYYMIKTHFETMDMVVNTGATIKYRFNKRQDRLYIDIDVKRLWEDSYLLIDCYRALNPNEFPKIWNDFWLKRYVTACIKRQWGQNLIKFNNVQLPGGVSFNGEKIYEEGVKEVAEIESSMITDYELPANFLVG